MARLLPAEDVARASQFEVERGDAKSRTEVGELTNGRETSSGDRRKLKLARDQQIGVSAAVRPADAAAELVQLREAVVVRAVDDDRVRTRNVDAVLDDGRGDENIV